MAYVRLNNHHRETVLKNLLFHRFNKEGQKLFDAEEKLFHEVVSVFRGSPKQQKLIDSAPVGFFDETDSVDFYQDSSTGGEKFRSLRACRKYPNTSLINNKIGLKGNSKNPPKIRIPYYVRYSRVRLIKKSKSLNSKVEKYFDEINEFNKKVKEASRAANSILESCTTYKMLLEKWPEVRPFCPHLEELDKNKKVKTINPKVNLPVVSMENVNNAFGLPV